jgi:hypothetical protein
VEEYVLVEVAGAPAVFDAREGAAGTVVEGEGAASVQVSGGPD